MTLRQVQISARRLLALLACLLLTLLPSGCGKTKELLGRATIPDMGPKLPLTVKMEFDPALTGTRLPYINACNAPFELRVGPELEAVLLQAAGQNFKGVQFAGAAPTGAKPDVTAQFVLQQSSLKVQTDGIYDRLPAELSLEAAVAFKDQTGRLLGERIIKTNYREKLIVEPSQHRCDIVSIDGFLQNAAVSLSVQFIREARTLLDPDGTLAATGQPAPFVVAEAPPPPAPVQPSAPPAPALPAGPPPPSAQPRSAVPTTAAPAAPVSPSAPAATVVPAIPSAPVVAAVPSTPQGSAALSFKATLLDENGNMILEGGERIKVRVDVVNTGLAPARGVSVSVTGTPAVVSQFPAGKLPTGDLQPGDSRSVEFVATLPQSVQPQRVELIVTVADAAGTGAPSQTLVASMRRGNEPRTARGESLREPGPREAAASGRSSPKRPAAREGDVDEIPPPSESFQQPDAHLLAIGIGAYRDEQIPIRKFAAQDAELVAGYFQSLGGVPSDNVRLLQDRRALRPDIEEAILDWLPSRVTPDSVVIVYFAGQAMVNATGETFLVPYEGSRTSTSRLYPLKDLQAALGKMKTRLTLLIFDGSVLRLGGDAKTKGKPPVQPLAPQWEAGARNIVRLIGNTGLQAGLEPDKLRHGLFTYYLLRGLKGEADANQDGDVTLGELANYLEEEVPIAAKSTFRQDQQPMVVPPLPATSKRAALPLSRFSNGASSDSR